MSEDKLEISAQFERLHANRQAVFTGIYLTLFSVAGGVAVGLIATTLSSVIPEFTPPTALRPDQWSAALLSLSTVLVLGVILSGYVLTVSYFYWEPTEADVVSPLLLGLAVCMTAAYVDDPAMWLVCLAGVAGAGALSYRRSEWALRNREVLIIEELGRFGPLREEMDRLKEQQLSHLRRNKRVSLLVGVSLLGGGLARGWFRGSDVALPDVAAVTALLIGACCYLVARYRAAFVERGRVLGADAERKLLDRLDGWEGSRGEGEGTREDSK